jgi:hypothetical protein
MSIQERINPDNLNIHQFQEVPEVIRPELPFDVERDISPETKNKVVEAINESLKFQNRLSIACNAKILWPEEKFDLSFLDDQSTIDLWKKNALATTYGINSLDFFYRLKVARPDLDLKISKYDWEDIRSALENTTATSTKVINTADVKILDPNSEFSLSPDESLAADEIEQAHELLNSATEKDAYTACSLARSLKLIDPTREYKLREEMWEAMHRELEKAKSTSDWTRYANLAANMKILVAHSVKITAPGVIDIQMYPPEDINQSTPQIPETRKF